MDDVVRAMATCSQLLSCVHACVCARASASVAVIVLNKLDLISAKQKEFVTALLRSLNPDAKLIESTQSKIDVRVS